MATLSPVRAGIPLLPGLELVSRGKVRDTYCLQNNRLLVVATDGISIFDFVLNAKVPLKGVILSAMNHFWLNYLADFGFKTHFEAAGAAIDRYLPGELRDNVDLQSRAMVVDKLEMAKYEFIFRICLTGSGLKAYNETGEVCGHKLPRGLQDGDELPYILDTPTDKAEEGHDEHVSAALVREKFPSATYRMINIIQIAVRFAKSRGIQLADTKFEGSADELGDEVLTPDSSRFWDLREWNESRKPAQGRRAPSSLDKQLVREWGKGVKIDKYDPEKPEDVEKVHALEVPESVINQTTQIYRYIFWRLTGGTIERYLQEVLNVQVPERPAKKIAIVCGSESDLPIVMSLIQKIDPKFAKVNVHIMSCHRNPNETAEYAKNGCLDADVVLCAGSKAFQLPGVIDAFAYAAGKNVRVMGVALGESASKALKAAQLSIEEIPGTPVIMDEVSGEVYAGEGGLCDAIYRIMHGELPPVRPRKAKPVQMNVWNNYVDHLEV
jgi:phosphoribosylaminoimidazole-succinocarboxamide synthase